ncbi:hypothetical protein HK100_001945 [Physocladia obscura]|uniref:F-box/LRR-repeat protein 15-like leucin rich repeat domain-containing protein n=1 Tax=Physocladia obscura TaxID=109957 RepID=A0AAD5SWH5_9FUNG|nr:hypothetical protein HK100_001945 [Physocladia obscura]
MEADLIYSQLITIGFSSRTASAAAETRCASIDEAVELAIALQKMESEEATDMMVSRAPVLRLPNTVTQEAIARNDKVNSKNHHNTHPPSLNSNDGQASNSTANSKTANIPIESRYGTSHRQDNADLVARQEIARLHAFKKSQDAEKKKLLKQIQDDRATFAERQRTRVNTTGSNNNNNKNTTADNEENNNTGFPAIATTPTTTTTITPPSEQSPETASILFRLPSSASPSAAVSVKHVFAASASVAILFDFLRSTTASLRIPQTATIALHAHFPSLSLHERDIHLAAADVNSNRNGQSLRDAGLCPSAALHVVFLDAAPPVTIVADGAAVVSASSAAFIVEEADVNMSEGAPIDENTDTEDEDTTDSGDNMTADDNYGGENETTTEDGDGISDHDEGNPPQGHVLGGGHIMGAGAENHRAAGIANAMGNQAGVGGVHRGRGGPPRGFGGFGLGQFRPPPNVFGPGHVLGVGAGGARGRGVGSRGDFGRGGGLPMPPGFGGFEEGAAERNIVGNRLGGILIPTQAETGGENQAHNERAARIAAIQNRTILQQQRQRTQQQQQQQQQENRKFSLRRSAIPLSDLAVLASVQLLSQNKSVKALQKHQLASLRRFNQGMTEKIVEESVKLRIFNNSFILRLKAAPIESLNLGSYTLATDSLLETISTTHWASLISLTLRGNEVITDEGIFSLHTCRNLKTLNISNTKHITDKAFTYLLELSALTNLDMSRVKKITSRGLALFATNDDVPALQSLNLTACSGITSADTFVHLSEILLHTSLRELSLQGCPLICPLKCPPIGACAALEVLDLSRIVGLTDLDLSTVSTFGSQLVGVDFSGSGAASLGTEQEFFGGIFTATSAVAVLETGGADGGGNNIMEIELPSKKEFGKGTREFLTRMRQLQILKLPRAGEVGVDSIIKAVCGVSASVSTGSRSDTMKITKLELDGFVYLSDAGMVGISRLSDTLRVLSLAGTGISGACLSGGISLLSGLSELNLDRTNVGNSVVAACSDMGLLEVLSLSETNLTDIGLFQFRTCRFRFTLKRLNLSRTTISEMGVGRGLHGFSQLVSLNVERSGVKTLEGCLARLDHEAQLAGVSLNNAIKTGRGIRFALETPDSAPTDWNLMEEDVE